MIIYRYIRKEVLLTTLGITTIAVFIFMVNLFGRYMPFLVSGKYAMSIITHLVFLEVPILYGAFLPFGLYLGFLLSYGRLYADSEMVVLKACGFGKWQLLNVTAQIAILTAICVIFLVMWIMPIANQHRDKLIDMASQTTSAFSTITPGRFIAGDRGDQVMYIQGMSPNRKHVHDVFVVQKEEDNKNLTTNSWIIFTAKKGYQYQDTVTGDQFIVAENGYRYEGTPGEVDAKIVKFEKYGFRVNSVQIQKPMESDELSTGYLIHNQSSSQNKAELQWRLSFPISVLLLAFIAVPLSQVKVRQGRFGRLVPAVFIYIIYVNLIFASRNWLTTGRIPAWIGLWWVHLLLLIMASILYFIQRDF